MKYKNFMQYAIKEAENAAMSGEVPVGAVIVCDREIISSAHNVCEKENALCHAEIIAINDAFKKLAKQDVSEDEIKELEDQIQKLTDKYIKEVDKAIENKSKEILTV